MTRPGRRLSALVANYQSSAFAIVCARSLERAWRGAGRAREALEVVVADDASGPAEEPGLQRLEGLGCRVLRGPENRGYAHAIQRAFAATDGDPDDLVAVLNADLRFAPKSLGALVDALEREGSLGAVAPRTFVDPSCGLELPRHALPSPAHLLRSFAAARDGRLARACADRNTRAWARPARAGLRELEMLSGACLVLRRSWIERAGGLLDEDFPFYFEDSDLCRRLAQAGGRLVEVEAARVTHFWARSSAPGGAQAARIEERFRSSRALYLERWHGGAARARVEQAERDWLASARAPAAACEFVDLGAAARAPRLPLTRPGPWILELGMAPNLWLAARVRGPDREPATLVDAACATLPPSAWDWLFAARYFARALDPRSLATLGAWTFEKVVAPRSDPEACDAVEEQADGRVA